MKATFATADFAVFDDFLDEESRQLVWNYVQAEDFDFLQVKRWRKTSRLLDGNALLSSIVYSHAAKGVPNDSVYPTGRGIDLVVREIISSMRELEPWAGREGSDWSYFTSRAYLYPQGVGLSWHDDYTQTTAQYVLYVHPYWNAHWGSELLVSDVRDMPRPRVAVHGAEDPVFAGPFLDNADESDRLMALGVGSYVLPKPNRLVIMASGVQHMVKKVEPAAGDSVRASVTGFFIDPDKADKRFS